MFEKGKLKGPSLVINGSRGAGQPKLSEPEAKVLLDSSHRLSDLFGVIAPWPASEIIGQLVLLNL